MLCCAVLCCAVLCCASVLCCYVGLCYVMWEEGKVGRLNRCLEFKGPQKIVFNSFSLSHNPKNTVLQYGVLWCVVLTPSV